MSDFHQRFVGQLQSLAISHAAWKGTADALVDALARTFGGDHSPDIRRLLYSQPLRAALHGRDVALWCGHDGLFRLIDQTPVGFPAAVRRVQHHPGGPQTCRYCLLTEPHALQPELEQERDPRGEFIPGSFVHPQCAAAWARLAAALQAEIDRAVEAAQEALRRAQPPRPVPSPSPEILRRLEALERRLQAPATLPEIHRIKIERDSAGLARAVTIVGTGQRLLVKRNAKKFITEMVPADTNAPVKPAPINQGK